MASMSSIGSERGDTQILAGFSGRDVHVEIPPLHYRHGLSNHLGIDGPRQGLGTVRRNKLLGEINVETRIHARSMDSRTDYSPSFCSAHALPIRLACAHF